MPAIDKRWRAHRPDVVLCVLHGDRACRRAPAARTTCRSSSTWWTSIRPSGRRSRQPARRRVRGSTPGRRAGSKRSRSTSRAAPSRRFSRPPASATRCARSCPAPGSRSCRTAWTRQSLRPTGPPPASQTVVFCGVMNYPPNDEGAVWLAREVWPRVRLARPDARLELVGSFPTSQVRQLANAADGVVVTGHVDDVRPHLWQAAVAAAPLQTARGVQNKVLEAVAAGLPAVVTPVVLEGVPAEVRPACAPAGDAFAFADRAHRFPRALAGSAPPGRRAGRRRVHFVGTSACAARGASSVGPFNDIIDAAMAEDQTDVDSHGSSTMRSGASPVRRARPRSRRAKPPSAISRALATGHKVLAFGNGGSAADAQHFASELVGRFEIERVGLRRHRAHDGHECGDVHRQRLRLRARVFARRSRRSVRAAMSRFGISTSGRSANVEACTRGCQSGVASSRSR